MPTPHDTLVRLMEARRTWLGEQWTDIARRGDVHPQNFLRLRNGIGQPSVKTLRAAETGLRWPRGIIDDILNTARPGTKFDYLIELGAPDTETGQNTVTVDDLRSQWQRIRDADGVAAADEWLLGQVRDRPRRARRDAG